ncbi:MAG TPA: RluA family pseudouridine synthase [Tepidisphaeraceae bacterium]|nr:RluA family pseudouridine synthase [Tepidisphaeraceae bacterium]
MDTNHIPLYFSAMQASNDLEIIYQDADCVAINKPAGLASIPGRGETSSVLQQLAEQLNLPWSGSADPRLRVVHRLDKETSGVLLMAKNLPTQRLLSEQFQNGKVQKEYLALVAGRPSADAGTINAPLGPHPTSRDRMAVRKDGKQALTEWKVEERFRRFALVRCFPRTGRTHQIRVHLQSIGLPLAVDPLYHPNKGLFLSSFKRDYRPTRGEDERPLIARLTLHAERLTFDHPSTGKAMIEAPLPKDFRATLNQLRRHGR